MNAYYIDLDGSTEGPFSLDELRGLYAARRISPATLYAKEGALEWSPIGTIEPLINPRPVRKPKARRGDWYCTTCGHVGRSGTFTKGSLGIEIVLWLFFLIPGLIYSLWRLSNRYGVCRNCDRGTIIPCHSPKAREFVDFQEGPPSMAFGFACIGLAIAFAVAIILILRNL